MNKKFTKVLLMMAVAIGGCLSVTSCKDTDDDLRVEWSEADADLQQKVNQLSSELEALKSATDACKAECQQKIADLLSKLADANAKIAENKLAIGQNADNIAINAGNIATNASEIATLKSQIGTISGQIADILTQLGNKSELTEADVKRIIESYTVDYYKELGLATAAELADYVQKADFDGLVRDIATLTQNVNTLTTQYNTVNGLVTTLQTNYNQLMQDLENGKYGLTKEDVEGIVDKAIEDLKNSVDLAINGLQGSITTINNQITNLQTSLTNLQNTYNTLSQEFQTAKQNIETQISGLESRVATLETTVQKISQIENDIKTIKTRLSQTEKDALAAYRLALANEQRLNTLDIWASTIDTQISTINSDISTMKGEIGDCSLLNGTLVQEILDLKQKNTDLENKINSVDTDLTQKINALDSKIDAVNTALGQDLKALETRVKANEDAISALQQQVSNLLKLENRLNSLITGVIVQGTFNPLFGTFSLPIGVQSNMLVNYYGYSEKQSYEFPSVQSFATYNNEPEITADEARMLAASGLQTKTIENGSVLMNENDGNLGKVFVTINPNNINFAGQDLTLVNSVDEASAVELRNLRPSKEVLTFGYSQSSRGGGSNNGFYEADATLPATLEAVNKTAVRIDDRLKSAMKTILKDKRNNLRSNLVGLMKALYDQFNGILPAYAMKAAWTVNDEPFAVYSNYNIAATTFRPLSYSFLYDKSYGTPLPIIDPISESLINLNPEDYHFDFKDITVNLGDEPVKLDLNIADVEITPVGEMWITVKADVKDKDGKVIGSVDTKVNIADDMNTVLKQIETDFNAKIGEWNKSIQTAFQTAMDEMLGRVDTAVKDMLDQMQGEINDKIDDMIGSIEDEVNGKFGSYIDKFNNFIERYNSLANRINNIFENPNHYLQPTMLYKGKNGGVHFLSNNIDRPTQFVKAGGNGVMLYATSYTAEIIAPAYAKVIACVDVIDNATKKSAQKDGGELLNDLKKINATQYLAEVRPGNQRRFAVSTENMKAGRTYEMLYTAVDYNGVTSTAHFYFTVVE